MKIPDAIEIYKRTPIQTGSVFHCQALVLSESPTEFRVLAAEYCPVGLGISYYVRKLQKDCEVTLSHLCDYQMKGGTVCLYDGSFV